MKLHELTYKEVKIFLERGVDTFILPVGTIEPHGPHLPLGTDAFIPEKIGEILSEKIKAVLLPTIYYGVTGSLHGYPGSIRIEPEVLEQLIYQVLKSMSFHGFKYAIILNGHGGSEQERAIESAAKRAWYELKLPVLIVDWWILAREKGITKSILGKEGGHAATDETVAMYACRPELVKPEYYDDEEIVIYSRALRSYPLEGTIINYNPEEGSVAFKRTEATEYIERVVSEIAAAVERFKCQLKRSLPGL